MRDATNKHLWKYRELTPIRFIDEDIIDIDLKTSDLIWHGVQKFVGVELKCIECKSIFLFTASEQKTWHHEWGFSIHAYPKRCQDCRKKGRYKKALIKKLQVCTKQFDNDIVRCNEVAEIVIELFQFGEQIDRRHGEKLLYFIKRSKYEHDLALRFKLLHKFSQ